jgi:hypothetical protein
MRLASSRRIWGRTLGGAKEDWDNARKSIVDMLGKNESTRASGVCGLRRSANRTLGCRDQRPFSAIAATTRAGTVILDSTFRTCPSFRKGLSSTAEITPRLPVGEE